MKLLVEFTEEQEKFLKQFAQNQCEGSKDNNGTAKPIHIVQTMDKEYYGIDEFDIAVEVKEYRTVSYHFTLAEAKRYIEYQRHNLVEPRTYTVFGGYANKGDYIPFWDLLMEMGTQLIKKEEEQLAYTE